jgi:hypothetical protein
MAKILVPQHFPNVNALAQHHGMILPKPHYWRLLQPCLVGAIHGIPTSQGTAVATNGILVAIQQPHRLFIGHFDWFVPDEQQPVVEHKEGKEKKERQARKPAVDITEFV